MKGMNGHVIDGTSICVDYWQWAPEKKYVYFLTHLHADHTVGLTSSFRERIYTSPFNAWLVERWFRIDPELVVPLTVGDSHVIYDETSEDHFSVTLIDANHCPGSTMFLFQGSFGNILYTGDFRYNQDMLEHPMMKSIIENEVVHKLYMDNTFAAEHCEFPTKSEALKDLMTLLSNHPDHYIVLGARKLGKEDVFREVALYLKETILVSEERFKILTYLKYPNVFTTNGKEARIMVKEMHQITSSFIHKLQEEKGPVLIVLLTALYSINPEHGRMSRKMSGVHHIPYSDHCSHSELQTFVSKVRPHAIYPIVLTGMSKPVNNEESSENDLNFWDHVQNLHYSSIIPTSILQLCRQPKAIELPVNEMTMLMNTNDTETEDDSNKQTEDKSTCVEPDEMEYENSPSGERNAYHCPDLASEGSVSCRVDTTADSITDEEYCTVLDNKMNQQNAVSNNVSTQPKPDTTDRELICNTDGTNIADKAEISTCSTYFSLPTPIFGSDAITDQQDSTSDDKMGKVNAVQSIGSNSMSKDHVQSSPSGSEDMLRKKSLFTNISKIYSTYDDKENLSSTEENGDIVSSTLISPSNQMKERDFITDLLLNLRKENSPKFVPSSNKLSNYESIKKSKAFDNPASNETPTIIKDTEENSILEKRSCNIYEESNNPVLTLANGTLTDCNHKLNESQVLITKQVALTEKSLKKYQSPEKSNKHLANELPHSPLSPSVISDSPALCESPNTNNTSLLHAFHYLEKNNAGMETIKYSQPVTELDPFYKQFKNVYKSWQNSIKYVQFKRNVKFLRLKNLNEINHRKIWKTYNWKSIFKKKEQNSLLNLRSQVVK